MLNTQCKYRNKDVLIIIEWYKCKKNETSNSKVVMILIYQNVTCRGKKSDFLFLFEHYKIPQYKEQINFKTKKW